MHISNENIFRKAVISLFGFKLERERKRRDKKRTNK